MNHEESEILKVFDITTDDIEKFLFDFAKSVFMKGKASYGIEEILIKLNNLEGKKKQKYWNTMLFFVLEGMTAVIKQHNQIVVGEMKEFFKRTKEPKEDK